MVLIRERAEQNPRRDGQSLPTKLIFVLNFYRGVVGRADYFESTHDEPNLLQSHRSAAPEPAVVASCRLEERFEGK